MSADDIVAVAVVGRQPRGARPGCGRRRPTRSPSPPSASSCRTSPAYPPSSTWPPCATPWRGSVAGRHRSTRSYRSSWSSTTRSSSSSRATASAYDAQRVHRVRAQPRALPVAALGPGRLRGLPGRATGHRDLPPGQPRVPLPARVRHRRTGGPSATRWSAPTRTPSWSTAWACSAGAWAASRLRRPCSASRSPCCCHPWWACASRARPRPGITATDVVLTVTELLRDHGVVGAFVECYGPGVAALPLETRATIGNMSPEYGATCAMFPIDQVTLDYLRFTGRDEEHLALVEAYAKAQGLWHDAESPEPVYSEHALARPGRRGAVAGRTVPAPGPGGAVRQPGDSFRVALDRARAPAPSRARRRAPSPDGRRRRGDRGHHELHQHLEPPGAGGAPACWPRRPSHAACGPSPGSRPRWLRAPGWSWTTSSPGRSGRAARAARLLPRRLRLHHLHRQLGPAARRRVRRRARGRPLGGGRALGQPQLRGPHPPRRPHELPGLAAAGGGLRPGRHHGPRPDHRAPRPRRRRQPGAALGHLAVAWRR